MADLAKSHIQRVDAFVTSTTGGAELNFRVRMLAGRARQLIHLHRIHHYIAQQPTNFASDYTAELVSIFQAGPEEHGSATVAPQARITTLFEGFTAGVTSLRNRAQVVDVFRVSDNEELDTAVGKNLKQKAWNALGEYDFLVPALHLFMGFFTNQSVNAFEVFTRVEYSWVDASISEIAAVQLQWGQDPIDFDRENL